MKLIISEAAQNDLQSIADYIAKDNPRNAHQFIQNLLKQCKKSKCTLTFIANAKN